MTCETKLKLIESLQYAMFYWKWHFTHIILWLYIGPVPFLLYVLVPINIFVFVFVSWWYHPVFGNRSLKNIFLFNMFKFTEHIFLYMKILNYRASGVVDLMKRENPWLCLLTVVVTTDLYLNLSSANSAKSCDSFIQSANENASRNDVG